MRLFICEKPSQARDIARVLQATRRSDGCLTGSGVTVTWCVGHLLETAPPEAYVDRYKRWTLEDLPIIPEQWQVVVKPKVAKQLKVIQGLLQSCAEVVIATDADREGEMIAREIIERCQYRGPIQRLWLSALDEASIRRALAALRPGEQTLPLYHCALARSRADWLIGINLSRLFTLLGQGRSLKASAQRSPPCPTCSTLPGNGGSLPTRTPARGCGRTKRCHGTSTRTIQSGTRFMPKRWAN